LRVALDWGSSQLAPCSWALKGVLVLGNTCEMVQAQGDTPKRWEGPKWGLFGGQMEWEEEENGIGGVGDNDERRRELFLGRRGPFGGAQNGRSRGEVVVPLRREWKSAECRPADCV